MTILALLPKITKDELDHECILQDLLQFLKVTSREFTQNILNIADQTKILFHEQHLMTPTKLPDMYKHSNRNNDYNDNNIINTRQSLIRSKYQHSFSKSNNNNNNSTPKRQKKRTKSEFLLNHKIKSKPIVALSYDNQTKKTSLEFLKTKSEDPHKYRKKKGMSPNDLAKMTLNNANNNNNNNSNTNNNNNDINSNDNNTHNRNNSKNLLPSPSLKRALIVHELTSHPNKSPFGALLIFFERMVETNSDDITKDRVDVLNQYGTIASTIYKLLDILRYIHIQIYRTIAMI